MIIINYVLIYIIFCLIVHLITIKLRNKIKWVIKLPKPLKYTLKTSPIYKIRKSDWNHDSWIIDKWELGYIMRDDLFFLNLLFIPYPIEFLCWKYNFVDSVYKINIDILNIQNNLEELYEKRWKEINNELLKEKSESEKKRDKINELNKIFNQNYDGRK